VASSERGAAARFRRAFTHRENARAVPLASMNEDAANFYEQQAEMARRSGRRSGVVSPLPVFAPVNMVPKLAPAGPNAPSPGSFAGYEQPIFSPLSSEQPQKVYIPARPQGLEPVPSVKQQNTAPQPWLVPSVQQQNTAPRPRLVYREQPDTGADLSYTANEYDQYDAAPYQPQQPKYSASYQREQQVPRYYPQQVPKQGSQHLERLQQPSVQQTWSNSERQHFSVPQRPHGQARQPHMVYATAPQRNSNELIGVDLFSNQNSSPYLSNNPVAADPMYSSNNGGGPMFSSNGNGPQQLYASYDPRDLPQYTLSQNSGPTVVPDMPVPLVPTQSPPVYYDDNLEAIAQHVNPEPSFVRSPVSQKGPPEVECKMCVRPHAVNAHVHKPSG